MLYRDPGQVGRAYPPRIEATIMPGIESALVSRPCETRSFQAEGWLTGAEPDLGEMHRIE